MMHGDAIIAELGASCPPHIAAAIRVLDAKANRLSNQVVLTDGETHTRLLNAVREAGSQAAFARLAGVSRQHLFDVLSGTRQPGPAILKVLRLKRFGGGNPTYTPID